MSAMGDAVRERGRTLDLSAAPPHRARGNRKDTRRWCRGKVGVEHAYRWTVTRLGLNVERCITCGRMGRYCFGWRIGKCICGAPEHEKGYVL